ncbi:hypothetical protein ACIGYQ_48045, partial [Streptomyces sp. NPDC053726]
MTRPIARVLLFPLAMAALLVGIYTAAMHAPTPHHLKIAVAGPPAQTRPLDGQFQGVGGRRRPAFSGCDLSGRSSAWACT